MNAYDDPYLMLAYYIVTHYGLPDIKRALTEDAWLEARVCEDCIGLDLAGPFLDAIMEYVDQHKRLWLRERLKALGKEMFTQLDLKRLRRNIIRLVVLS